MPDTAPVEEIVAALGGRRSGDGWTARCPAHDDSTPSLSIAERDGKVLVHCHAGCAQADVLTALRARGLWPAAGADAPEPVRRTRYVVRDADGTPVAVHVRKDRPGCGKKMWWTRPDGTKGLGGCRLVDLPLYGTERLAAAEPGATVIVTEGERATDALTALGVLSVSTVTGAAATSSEDVLRVLVGRDVVLWADHDDDGRQHMAHIAARLRALGVQPRMLHWTGAREEGDDAADFVDRGGTPEALAALVAAAVGENRDAPEMSPPGAQGDRNPHLAAVPRYPTDAVPEPLRSLVLAGSRAGLQPEYVAAGGLVALAYVALDCRVVVSPNWIEAPALWVSALGPASTGKSPGWRYGWSTIWEAETTLRALYTDALSAWRALPTCERKEPPARTTRVVSDATVEALVRRLSAAGPQVLVVDELRSWLGGLGRYGSGAAAQRDLGHYLTMWDASVPLAYDRVGGDTSIVADYPAVSIIGTLQVEDHRLLGGVETGLRARWLPHVWRHSPDATHEGDHPTEAPVLWVETIRRLAGDRSSVRLELKGEARRLWDGARIRWSREVEDASPGIRAATQKADRQALRVALVFAIGMGASESVPDEAMSGAIAIVDYALAAWRSLPEGEELTLSRTAERTSVAVDRLAAWLTLRPDGCATRDRILRAQVGGIRTAATLDVVLKHYEETYPGSLVDGESTSRGGRRGVRVFAPRRETQAEFPRHRGNSGTHSETADAPQTQKTQGLPRDRPEGTPPPEGTPGTRLPEGTRDPAHDDAADAEVVA